MHIGFTGSRDGMTPAQEATLKRIVGSYFVKEMVAYHGYRIGADAQFHAIVKELGGRVAGHPAFEEGNELRGVLDAECDEIRPIENLNVPR